MRFLKLIIYSLLALLCFAISLLFTLRNTEVVTLDLYFTTIEGLSFSLWLFTAFALGIVCGVMTFSILWLRLKTKQIVTQRKLTKTQQELAVLKTPTLNE